MFLYSTLFLIILTSFYHLTQPLPPRLTLFPYTTLFRSIRKNEERRADRPDAAVQGESVQDRAHPRLAQAEMDMARAPAPGRHVAPVLEGEVRRGREVRRPADELGEPGREGVQHLPRRRARGLGMGGGGGGGGGGRERRETVVPAVRQTAGEPALELRGELRECLPIRFVLLRPLGFEAGRRLPGRAPG